MPDEDPSSLKSFALAVYGQDGVPAACLALQDGLGVDVNVVLFAAFVGAGGLGERIVAGLAVNDTDRMLAGAVPAALLALAVQGLFTLAERRMLPAALR